MKIYTKTGDKGETGLFGGERVRKDHPRLMAYGTIDELNSLVGWLRCLDLDNDIDQVLEGSQHILFDIGAELATPDPERLKGKSRAVNEEDIQKMEQAIDKWEEELDALDSFILPGGTEAAVRAHILRTVVRRAEREIIRLTREIDLSPDILKYINRLSDFAFVLARVLNKRAGQTDVKWEKSVKGKK